MVSFKVITWDFNHDCIEHYDVMPYFYSCIEEEKKSQKLKDSDITFEWLKDLIKRSSIYLYWAKCEYECIVHGWPMRKNDHKLDAHEQVMMNLDVITNLILADIKK